MNRPVRTRTLSGVGGRGLETVGYSWVHLRYGLPSCGLETHDPGSLQRRFLMLPRRTDNSSDGT